MIFSYHDKSLDSFYFHGGDIEDAIASSVTLHDRVVHLNINKFGKIVGIEVE